MKIKEMLQRARARISAFWKAHKGAIQLTGIIVAIVAALVLALALIIGVFAALVIGGLSFYEVFFTDGIRFVVWNPFEYHEMFTQREVLCFGWLFAGVLAWFVGFLVYLLGRKWHLRIQRVRDDARRIAEAQVKVREALKQEEVERAYQKGRAEGAAVERAIVRKALLHGLKPKMLLPSVEKGYIRLFWINVTMDGSIARPTGDRRIHHTVTEGMKPPRAISGAPFYDQVKSSGPDELSIMGVVYTLDIGATAWS